MNKVYTRQQIFWTMGRLIGQTWRPVSGVWDALRQTKSRIGIRLLSGDDLRKIISEYLVHLNPEPQAVTLQEYDRRISSLTEALRALQEKINDLQLRGHLNRQTMSQTIGEIQGDAHFSESERNILATILKQNIVLQKPEMAQKGRGARDVEKECP
ncbi:MAG: hypothetical protein HQL23_07645 [Candidatus Omnitrophica bacterium]|nr:hypothetical protein [Candidatus Omnitrophota bacterium]